jgi:hypothetical protein
LRYGYNEQNKVSYDKSGSKERVQEEALKDKYGKRHMGQSQLRTTVAYVNPTSSIDSDVPQR